MDANDGTHFGRELATAGTSGKWVDYTYINPATGNEERKRSWIKRKDDLLFLTGWYSVEDTTTPADRDANPGLYAKQLVADAVAYYDENGADAATSYYNSDESMDGEWYVAIFGPDGKMIAHPDAALLGREHTSFVDSKGKEFGKDLAAATGDGVWVDYILRQSRHRLRRAEVQLGRAERRPHLRLRLVHLRWRQHRAAPRDARGCTPRASSTTR